MSRITSKSSLLVGIEIIEELVSISKQNLVSDGVNIDLGNIVIRKGDGWEGVSELGPFDAINVGAASDVAPIALLRQLKKDGVLV